MNAFTETLVQLVCCIVLGLWAGWVVWVGATIVGPYVGG